MDKKITKEQRERWLATLKTHGLVSVHPTSNRYYALPSAVDDLLTVCATITAEAVSAIFANLRIDGEQVKEALTTPVVDGAGGVYHIPSIGNAAVDEPSASDVLSEMIAWAEDHGIGLSYEAALTELRERLAGLKGKHHENTSAAERSRVAEGSGMTDDAAVKLAQDMNVLPTRAGCAYCPTEEAVVAYSRSLIAEASARAMAAERERCARWHDHEEAEHRRTAKYLAGEGNDADAADADAIAEEHKISAAAHRAGEE